jgi:hypothetical protein
MLAQSVAGPRDTFSGPALSKPSPAGKSAARRDEPESAGMTPAEMQSHVERIIEAAQRRAQPGDLAVYFDVENRDDAYVIPEVGEAHLPLIRSEKDYATALHELGHLFGRYQRGKQRGKTLTRERWAWAWARRTALIWTSEMEDDAAQSLAWYASNSGEN